MNLRQSISDDFTRMPTALVNLSPAFMAALKKVAPKKRRSRVPYVLALAVLAVLAVLASDRSTREFAVVKGAPLAARLHLAPAAKPVAPAVVAAPAAAPESDSIATVIAVAPVVSHDPAPPVVAAEAPSSESPAASEAPEARSTKKSTAKKGQRRVTAPAKKKPTSMLAAKISRPR